MKLSTNTLIKRLQTLAMKRIVQGDVEKTAKAYSSTVAEIARRTRKSPKRIRTMVRRRVRSDLNS